MFDDWLPFAMYAFFALAIPASMVFASFTLSTRPKQKVRARTIPFESGVSQGAMPKQRFTVSFYLTAMLFILFDMVFLGILLLAYVYIWRKGALEWR